MKRYQIIFSKQAKKDIEKLSPALKKKLEKILIDVISVNPYAGKALRFSLKGFYSYRLSYQDRIVYSIHEKQIQVLVYRARTHYGE